MAQDRREGILHRLEEILGGVRVNGVWQSGGLSIPILGDTGVPNPVTMIPAANFSRNRNQLTVKTAPAILLLDADEVRDASVTSSQRGLRENRMRDQIMKMTPEIYVVLDDRNIVNKNSGRDLNTARLAILAAIIPDVTLQKIVSAQGDMVYDGTVTDFARNRQMKGQLGISLTFTYPLIGQEVMGVVG
jgi:hypothetical protein